MLSGGATMGMFHVGVVKALWEQDLVPEVLSGSSAGSIVAAAVGSRAPEDYPELLTPEALHQEFLHPVGLQRMFEQQAVMDPAPLRECLVRVLGDMTFAESHERSGKVVNIAISPARSNQIPRLVNHLTFPHLYMNDAVMASCALPFLFPPAVLSSKNVAGEKEPFTPSQKWVDGSLKSDRSNRCIPSRLALTNRPPRRLLRSTRGSDW